MYIQTLFPVISDSSRKRKGDRSISPSEDTDRKHKRDKSEPSSPPGKKDRKPERKRVNTFLKLFRGIKFTKISQIFFKNSN